MKCFRWPILYGNKTVILNIILLKTHFRVRKCNEKCNEIKSSQQSNNAMKNNQQGRQSKSPFKAFLGTNYYSKYYNFLRQPAMVANIFSVAFLREDIEFLI